MIDSGSVFQRINFSFCGSQVWFLWNSSLHGKNQVCVLWSSNSFCGIQIFVSWNSSLHQKNQGCVSRNSSFRFEDSSFRFLELIQVFVAWNSSLRFVESELTLVESSVHRMNQVCVSEESRLHRKNQVCASKELSLHRMNQVFVNGCEPVNRFHFSGCP